MKITDVQVIVTCPAGINYVAEFPPAVEDLFQGIPAFRDGSLWANDATLGPAGR